MHEIKLNGYRMHTRIDRGHVQLLTRTGLDWTAKYPTTATALQHLPVEQAYIDGGLRSVAESETILRVSSAPHLGAYGTKAGERLSTPNIFVCCDLIHTVSMPSHRFSVGQTVMAPPAGRNAILPPGPYVILRLLPLEGRQAHYRVKSTVDGHERALLESQTRLVVYAPANKEIASAKAPPKPRTC